MSAITSSLQKAIDWHNAWASKKRIVVLLLIYPVFPVLLLPWIGDVGGAPILDLRLFYDAEVVAQVFTLYDESAMANYRLCALTVDMVYPVYYAFLLSLIIAKLSQNSPRSWLAKQPLRLLPFLVMVVDWWENVSIVSLLDQWPDVNNDLANLAGYITLSKWALLALVVLIIVSMSINTLVNKRKQA